LSAACIPATKVADGGKDREASPCDKLIDGRFDPLMFPTRNIAPLGYAVFAVVAGATIGLLTRRTIAAMAITLAVFAVPQILLPTAIRPHLQPAVTETVAFDASAAVQGSRINIKDDIAKIEGYAMPGAWVLSASTGLLDAANGTVCPPGSLDPTWVRRNPAEGTSATPSTSSTSRRSATCQN
jgi:hypothetical protein